MKHFDNAMTYRQSALFQSLSASVRLHLYVVILTWMETDGASLKMTPTAAGFTPTWPCLNLLWWWVSLAVTSDLCCCINSENNLSSERLFCVGTEVRCVALLWFHFGLGKSGFSAEVAVWCLGHAHSIDLSVPALKDELINSMWTALGVALVNLGSEDRGESFLCNSQGSPGQP